MKKQIYKPNKPKKKFNKHWKAYLLITCLLVNIQVTPIIINYFYPHNSYEDLLKNIFCIGFFIFLFYGILHLAYIADNGISFDDE